MRSLRHSLFGTAVAVLTIAGARLSGQASPLPILPSGVSPGIDSSTGELSPQVRIHVARGDALIAKRHYADGEREFRLAISRARQQRHLASFTCWRLASAYYYEGRPAEAARTLDRLATDAAAFGDLPIEARALFNAAWLYGQAGNGREASARVTQLEKLLRSPYMPVDVRNLLRERLANPAVATAR